ncbi:MgtC/SapB family protein [Bordetella sp. LUAb4]|uniref:MgtC/SapB family protein n=1 Tax=Bordetella sp. LUAb4 TaxID=2843195 RepID=UPI001E3AA5EA|nr:MgtC/SapB family protein [Bordetella sp. LUAb4]
MSSTDIIWDTVRTEFSDLHDLASFTRVFIRLMLAVILGGILGYERQSSGKPAGLRTHMLVSLGAALFVLVPLQSGMPVNDVSRVLQGVIAGIGFLGAGAIIKMSEEGQIKGLTTAASIWLTAAIGVAAGMGREATAVFATLLALIILGALHKLDKHISAKQKKHHSHEQASSNDAPPSAYRDED